MQWVHLHPRGPRNKFRRNLQGKCVSASAPYSTPSAAQAEQESTFRTFFLLWEGRFEVEVVHLVVSDRVLMATTKKGRQLFEEKSACPQTNSWLRYWHHRELSRHDPRRSSEYTENIFGSRRKVISGDAVRRNGRPTGRLLHARKTVARWSGETIIVLVQLCCSELSQTDYANQKHSSHCWWKLKNFANHFYRTVLNTMISTAGANYALLINCCRRHWTLALGSFNILLFYCILY